jgi:hypothetical protein
MRGVVQNTMKEKTDNIVKFIPAATLLCYICGFVIIKSFLFQFGIVETEILNVRFIEAGILYLMIAPFVLATPLITNKKFGYFGSAAIALFAFVVFDNLIGIYVLSYKWKAYLIVILLNIIAYTIWTKHVTDSKRKIFDLSETPLFFVSVIISSLILFGFYYKEIKNTIGGGESYRKILIINSKNDNIIKTDSLCKTDTLIIIYENSDFIYYKDHLSTKSIRKDFVAGEIMIK